MAKTRWLPVLLAAVMTVCANKAALPVTVHAEELPCTVSTVSADSTVIPEEGTSQNTDTSGTDEAEKESEAPAPDGNGNEPEAPAQIENGNESEAPAPDENGNESGSPLPDGDKNAEIPAGSAEPKGQPENSEKPDTTEPLSVEQPENTGLPETAKLRTFSKQSAMTLMADSAPSGPGSSSDEHHLAFASDYHSTDGSISKAMSGMPKDTEYVSLIGDMVGDRDNFYPEYDSREILNLVKNVFPDLDSSSVSIVWATHDRNVKTTAGIIRNVLFLHGHNHTNDPQEYYYGAGTEMNVQIDKSSDQSVPSEGPGGGAPPFNPGGGVPPFNPGGGAPPFGPRPIAEGVLSNIYYTSLTAGYLKTSGNATLVTVKNGALTLTKYTGGNPVSLGFDASGTPVGNSITIAAQQHIQGQSVREKISVPTCEHGGVWDLAVYCTVCGQELSRSQVVAEAAGHNWGAWTLTRKATENAEGEESRSCSVCGKTESRPIPVLSPEKGINPESHEKPGNKEPQSKPKNPVPPGQSGNPVSPDNSPSYEAPAQMAYAPGPETAVPPQTGDDSQCILWVTLICLSLLSLMTISSRRAE